MISESVLSTIGDLVMFPDNVTHRISARAISVATSFTTVLIGRLFPFLCSLRIVSMVPDKIFFI